MQSKITTSLHYISRNGELITLITRYFPFVFVFSFQFFLLMLCISLVLLIFCHSAEILLLHIKPNVIIPKFHVIIQ